jgi:Ca2+-binding RTX toxin-like protein
MVIHVRTPEGREAALSTVSDQIRVQDWSTAQRRVEVLQFVDGTDFDVSGVVNTYLGVSGQSSAETLTGSTSADWMNGFGGDDKINSTGGNDFVFGEAGHDTIDAGDGDDVVSGGTGNDIIQAGAGTDMVAGGDGDDQLNGQSGNDLLFGGTGDDRIDGGDGDDYIVGDQGNDTYVAGKGTDVYRFGFGDGQDTYIGSNATDIKGTDVIMLEDDISKDRLWFTRSGDDLVMQILGTEDQIRFQAWYSGNTPSRHVLGFDLGEEVLSYTKVNDLVNAMASFTPNDGSTAYGIRPEDLPQQVSNAMNSAWVKV